MNIFEYHLRSIPHLVESERDTDRYLRAFAAMVERLDPEADRLCETDAALDAARDAIRFIADDAFRRGFEACHENVLVPLRECTITREVALTEMREHGERARQTIVAKFEEAPGVPNQLTVDIEDVELPEPRLKVQQ